MCDCLIPVSFGRVWRSRRSKQDKKRRTCVLILFHVHPLASFWRFRSPAGGACIYVLLVFHSVSFWWRVWRSRRGYGCREQRYFVLILFELYPAFVWRFFAVLKALQEIIYVPICCWYFIRLHVEVFGDFAEVRKTWATIFVLMLFDLASSFSLSTFWPVQQFLKRHQNFFEGSCKGIHSFVRL